MAAVNRACPGCYELAPRCNKGNDPTARCAGDVADAAANRVGDGRYATALSNSLPMEAQNAAGMAIQTLTHQVTAAAAFPAGSAEELLMSTPVNLVFKDMPTMVIICTRFIDQIAVFKPLAMALMGTASITNAQLGICKYGLDELSKLEDRQCKQTSDTRAQTTAEFTNTQTPRVSIFQTITKSVEKGNHSLPAGQEMLDLATGRKMVPFEKAIKITSSGNMMYIMYLYVTTISGLLREAFKVYDHFMRDVNLVVTSRGHFYAQDYVTRILESLDMKIYSNMPQLYSMGEHNRIASILAGTHNNVGGQGLQYDADYHPPAPGAGNPGGGAAGGAGNDPRKRIHFGPIKQPIGGAGAGVITDWKTKKPQKCNRFHATPQLACTAGIPENDPRFTPAQVGLCAYQH